MGVRSNVYIYIMETEDTKKLFGTLEDIISKAEEIECYTGIDNDVYEIGHNSAGHRILRVYFGDIKWYYSYPFIKYWDSIMNTLDNEELEKLYIFTQLEEGNRFDTRGELGEAYEYVDYDLSIDYNTSEDEVYRKIRELREYIAHSSGIGDIIKGNSWRKENESKVVTRDNIEAYVNTDPVKILSSLIHKK